MAVLVPVLAVVALAVMTVSSHASVRAGDQSLAKISLPFGGGKIERAVAVGGTEQKVVPVRVSGDQVWPTGKLSADERVTVEVTVKRPGWNSWLAGSTEQVKLTETTPATHPTSAFVTRKRDQPLVVHFDHPVEVVAYGTVGSRLRRRVLSSAQTTVSLDEKAAAGTIEVAVASRKWEKLKPTAISWFPAGSKATAVATPSPGSTIGPGTGITITFSKPVSKVLGGHLPPVSPQTDGTWHRLNAHTIRFEPTGYGYGLGAQVSINLPAGVNLIGGVAHGSDPVGKWTVPAGTTLRLQQLLAQLGYLPVNFTQSGTPVASTVAAEEAAAVKPPAGSFSWRYPNTPSELKAMWSPDNWSELTKGAVMAFEDAQGLTVDGIPGPTVWKALLQAASKDQRSTFGYTFVEVSETVPENIHVWHNGKIVVSGPVNTGIPAAPTATGTYAVYEHIPSGTMSGKNPDGTTYDDPGIPWISYFNGGDALHGFIRASYGFPQSLGCVEMPFSEAGDVYPYTPIGTIVNIVP